nr:hypothetical protein [Tanacetum cinerariifolium]
MILLSFLLLQKLILLDELADELTLLKSISPGINETDCDPGEDIHLIERLLYDNSFPRPLEEFVSKKANADIESFSPSPIPEKSPDLLSHRCLKNFQLSAKCPMMIHGKNIPILDVLLFYFYPP